MLPGDEVGYAFDRISGQHLWDSGTQECPLQFIQSLSVLMRRPAHLSGANSLHRVFNLVGRSASRQHRRDCGQNSPLHAAPLVVRGVNHKA